MKRQMVVLVLTGALAAPLVKKAWDRIDAFVEFLDESENPYAKE